MTSPLDKTANPGKTGQVAVDKALAELTDAINQLRKVAVCGLEVKGLRSSASPGVIKVPHGLGYKPSGWVLTRVVGAAPSQLYEIPANSPTKELWLQFVGSTDMVIDVRVF